MNWFDNVVPVSAFPNHYLRKRTLIINSDSAYSSEEKIECLELQIAQLEGKTEKLKNPYKSSNLKRYIWAIARLGGWKGYLSERRPGITTFWIGLD